MLIRGRIAVHAEFFPSPSSHSPLCFFIPARRRIQPEPSPTPARGVSQSNRCSCCSENSRILEVLRTSAEDSVRLQNDDCCPERASKKSKTNRKAMCVCVCVCTNVYMCREKKNRSEKGNPWCSGVSLELGGRVIQQKKKDNATEMLQL
ncbi:hypothetical protein LZ30DRAFT_367489 [Colletotrichum cereale]|nr:hypothetical protein LZ30DRAFT_367489 [Colletotrichum cereale]